MLHPLPSSVRCSSVGSASPRLRAGLAGVLPGLLILVLCACGEEGPGGADAAAPPLPPSITAGQADRLLGARDPGYVGDAACTPCHGDVVERYSATNHGRSLTAFDPAQAPERFVGSPEAEPAAAGVWVDSPTDGLRYRAELRDGGLVHREVLVDPAGAVVHDLEVPADQVIGSGNQTRSYLTIRNGRVSQMPLTWYAQDARWDLSPGYHEANDRFSRPIILQCLACHGDLPRLEPHTQNVFQELPRAISCERCHGPGAEHVERRSAGQVPPLPDPDGVAGGGTAGEDAVDPWTVNPAHLDRARQMSVCLQCHLAGVITYPGGEDPTTFRPGMELSENRAVFVPSLQLEDPDWVGIDSHPIRLARSACFQASEMTCLTCHLAHTPGEEVPPSFYRDRCVACHAGEPEPPPGAGDLCSRPGVTSPQDARSGDCVSCHLSAGGTSDVPHVRFTDHWIQRVPRPPLPPEAGRPAIDSPRPLSLVEVASLGVLARPDLLVHRSTALEASLRAEALFHFYETMHRHPGYLPTVVTAGRRAESQDPHGPDFTAEGRLALARALLELDSVAAAEGVLRGALEVHPDDPWGHFLLGALLDERRGRPADALPHLDHALVLQPLLAEARAKRADVLVALGRFDEARQELERVVEEEPLHRPRSWFNLGLLRLEAGDARGAVAAFQWAADTDPRNAEPPIQLGTLHLGEGDPVGAEAAFRRAVVADAEHPGAHGSLALALLEQGRTDEARTHLQRVLELDPGNQPARDLLGRIGG
jgi:tetratricopeptide (TPR) repeat protein